GQAGGHSRQSQAVADRADLAGASDRHDLRHDAFHAGAGAAAGITLTRLPARSKSTTPSVRANSVSSRPRPTLRPGRNLVPRCRTMTPPARTSCPPYTFTPRRFGFESRPLRLEPCPFLCAMTASARTKSRGPCARGIVHYAGNVEIAKTHWESFHAA